MSAGALYTVSNVINGWRTKMNIRKTLILIPIVMLLLLTTAPSHAKGGHGYGGYYYLPVLAAIGYYKYKHHYGHGYGHKYPKRYYKKYNYYNKHSYNKRYYKKHNHYDRRHYRKYYGHNDQHYKNRGHGYKGHKKGYRGGSYYKHH